MNFKIIFAVIGLILSMVYSAQCYEMCIDRIACGSDGEVYPNPCELEEAQESNPSLHEVPCGSAASK